MKLTLRNNKDFWAGLTFAGAGAAAMFIARTYPFGTTLRMGPGYSTRRTRPSSTTVVSGQALRRMGGAGPSVILQSYWPCRSPH